MNSRDLVEGLGVSLPTANKVLSALESKGVLREVTGRRRNRLYLADGIMEILR